MRMAAMCSYDVPIVALSIFLAVVISFIGLRLVFRARNRKLGGVWQKIASALVMGAAIPIMHYTGMAAASFHCFQRSPGSLHMPSRSRHWALPALRVVAIAVLAIATLGSIWDRMIFRSDGGARDRPNDAIACSLSAALRACWPNHHGRLGPATAMRPAQTSLVLLSRLETDRHQHA